MMKKPAPIYLAVVLFCAICTLFGCAQPQSGGASSSSDAAASGIQASEPTSYHLSLGFIGDICLADNYIPMEHLAEIGSTDIADGIDPVFIQIMKKMDLMWANNEFVFSDQGEALEGKAFTFKGSPKNVHYLHDLGIDVVGLANNHVFDYGEAAFFDTLQTLEDAGIPYTGAGRNEKEARGPVYLDVEGFKIALVNASSAEYTIYTPEAIGEEPGIAWCYDTTKMIEDIQTAAQNADFVIALPHWGTEHSTELTWEQTEGARAFIDAGADAVIGAHAHNLQGMEYYNGKPILYNLGNFWFDDYDVVDTVVAEVRLTGEIGSKPREGKIELVLHPGTQSEVYTAYASTAEERDRIFRYIEAISTNITIDENGILHEVS